MKIAQIGLVAALAGGVALGAMRWRATNSEIGIATATRDAMQAEIAVREETLRQDDARAVEARERFTRLKDSESGELAKRWEGVAQASRERLSQTRSKLADADVRIRELEAQAGIIPEFARVATEKEDERGAVRKSLAEAEAVAAECEANFLRARNARNYRRELEPRRAELRAAREKVEEVKKQLAGLNR